MATTLRIATRRSRLAMWQANQVKNLIQTATNGDVTCELRPMTTSGDRLQDKALHSQGGKGLFLKELETALLNNEADFAVHSMKDVPIEVGEQFKVHSVGERGQVNDVFLGRESLLSLPVDAKIGTSSLRRRALLSHVYRKKQVVEIRGNVETRLRKLDDGIVDGLVLAAAGLNRLGLEERITDTLPVNEFVPAVGQGVLAVEYLEVNEEVSSVLVNLIQDAVENAVAAERQVAARLGADCASAFGSYCEFEKGNYCLRSVISDLAGNQVYRVQIESPEADAAATKVAELLLAQDATQLLHES